MPGRMNDRYSALVAWDDNGVTRRAHMTGPRQECLMWLGHFHRMLSAEISHVIAETTEGELRDALTMRVSGFNADGRAFSTRIPRPRVRIANGDTLAVNGVNHQILMIGPAGVVHVGAPLDPPPTMRVRGFRSDGEPFDTRVTREAVTPGYVLSIGGMRHRVVITDPEDGTVHVGRGY